MENMQDINKICRTCLTQAKLMQTIFEVKVSDEYNVRVIDFIRRLTSIKITRCDDLPNNICIHCMNELCKAFNFAQMCINNDLKLKKDLRKNETIKLCTKTDAQTQNQSSENSNCKIEIIDQHEKNNYNEIIIIKKSDDYKIVDCYESEDHDIKGPVQYIINLNHKENNESKSENTIELYKCNLCNKAYKKESQLKAHQRNHKIQEEFVCSICGQKFNYFYLLKKHSYKHQDSKPFPCSFCDKGCITAESLRRHMKTHDKDYVKKMHACNVCLKEFPYPSFLAEHMKNHTGEKPFLCSFCGKGFRQSGTLQYHMRSHTGARPYTCNICNNSFTSPGVLRVHMRRHTNERPYICDICGMAFRQSTDMKSHRRTHTGDKPALCTICGKRFSSSGQLNIHIRSHTGEKPFLCSSCSKSFATKTMLVKHERIHTGERPYVCKICLKAFNQSSTLKTHLNTHKSLQSSSNRNAAKSNVQN